MIKFRSALLGGLCGSIAVVVLAGIFALFVKFVPTLSKISARAELTPITWWSRLGLAAMAVCGGVIIALLYALVFEFVTRRAGWLIGAAIGVMHATLVWLGAGLAAWWFPDFMSAFAGELSLLFHSLLAIAAFLALHVVYGAIVGAMYGPPNHAATTTLSVVRPTLPRDTP